MKHNNATRNTRVSGRTAVIIVLGCVVGAYAATTTIKAAGREADTVASLPEITTIETTVLAGKDAKIEDLGATVKVLQAENATLVSENTELLSDLATLLIQKTSLEAMSEKQPSPAYVVEKASVAEDLTVVEHDVALRPDNTEGSKPEDAVQGEMAREDWQAENADPDPVTDTASTYLALLQGRYAELSAGEASSVDLGSIAKILQVLDEVDREALLFAEGMKYDFTDAQRDLYEQYRVALLSHQSELLPQMRDAFGPAMRANIGGQGYSIVTSGAGYRKAVLKSDQFLSTSEIEQFHAGIHEWMVRMRFKEAVYMNADGTQIYGTVDMTPIPDDSLLINDRLIDKSVN